jgi:hypothetical protein
MFVPVAFCETALYALIGLDQQPHYFMYIFLLGPHVPFVFLALNAQVGCP